VDMQFAARDEAANRLFGNVQSMSDGRNVEQLPRISLRMRAVHSSHCNTLLSGRAADGPDRLLLGVIAVTTLEPVAGL
jgi:hypothetical protein